MQPQYLVRPNITDGVRHAIRQMKKGPRFVVLVAKSCRLYLKRPINALATRHNKTQYPAATLKTSPQLRNRKTNTAQNAVVGNILPALCRYGTAASACH